MGDDEIVLVGVTGVTWLVAGVLLLDRRWAVWAVAAAVAVTLVTVATLFRGTGHRA